MKDLCRLKEIFRIIYNFDVNLKKRLDISINESITLCTISGGKITPGQMAKELGISISRMSRVFSSLEEKELIKRDIDKDDKRKMVFSLTIRGKQKIREIYSSDIDFPDIELHK